MKTIKVGKMKVEIIQQDGSTRQITLTNCKYVPELYCKLFSVTTALAKGFSIGNDDKIVHLGKGDFKMTFDKVLDTKTGFILGIDMVQQGNEMAQSNLLAGREVNINELHEMLGHAHEDVLRTTAKTLNLKVTGNSLSVKIVLYQKHDARI